MVIARAQGKAARRSEWTRSAKQVVRRHGIIKRPSRSVNTAPRRLACQQCALLLFVRARGRPIFAELEAGWPAPWKGGRACVATRSVRSQLSEAASCARSPLRRRSRLWPHHSRCTRALPHSYYSAPHGLKAPTPTPGLGRRAASTLLAYSVRDSLPPSTANGYPPPQLTIPSRNSNAYRQFSLLPPSAIRRPPPAPARKSGVCGERILGHVASSSRITKNSSHRMAARRRLVGQWIPPISTWRSMD